MDIMDYTALDESWETLARSDKPICIYGTGNACERILDEFEKRGIVCAGIFASDGFARGQSFRGFEVKTLSQAEEELGEITVCCAFGSSLPEVTANISAISSRHRLVFPDLPIAGDELFSKDGFLSRFSRAQRVYNLLADDASRRVFESVMRFRLSGDISHLADVFTDADEDFRSLIKPQRGEVYADLGAYSGDTAERFINYVGADFERIYLFEPDKRSFRKCVKRLIGYDNISFINACAWDENTCTGFSQSAGRQSAACDNGDLIAARTLDSVLGGKRCDIIKYDVEGAERRALLGSADAISKHKPRLAVSAYHRPYDIIELSELILSLYPEYKLYLRQPPYFPAWDTIIYAV